MIVGDACHHRFGERGLGDGLGDLAQFGRRRRQHRHIRMRFLHRHRHRWTAADVRTTAAAAAGCCCLRVRIQRDGGRRVAALNKVRRYHGLEIVAGERSTGACLLLLLLVVGLLRFATMTIQ